MSRPKTDLYESIKDEIIFALEKKEQTSFNTKTFYQKVTDDLKLLLHLVNERHQNLSKSKLYTSYAFNLSNRPFYALSEFIGYSKIYNFTTNQIVIEDGDKFVREFIVFWEKNKGHYFDKKSTPLNL